MMGKRQRSPNYPVIDLEKALQRAREIYDEAKGHVTPLSTVQKWWGLKSTSSMGYQILAALRSYRLVEVAGSKTDRQVRVLDGARRILLSAPDALDHLQDCAKAPAVNAELLDMATEDGLPPRETIKHYLVFDRPESKFNEDIVDSIIDRFMNTVRFAKLYSSGIIEDEKGHDQAVSVGDYAQWTSHGVAQFKTPKRVVALSDDAAFAFVEGEKTGVPVEQLAKVDPPGTSTPPPLSPFFDGTGLSDMKQDIFALDEGQILVRWPDTLSAASYNDVKEWLKILERKIGRCVAGEAKE